MRRSHFTVLRNPCTQLTLTIVSQKQLTVLSFNSLRPSKEVGTQESHSVTQISHPTGGQPSLNSRGQDKILEIHLSLQLLLCSVRSTLWIAFTDLPPSCLHKQDLGTFPHVMGPPHCLSHRSAPLTRTLSTFSIYSLDTGKNTNISLITVIITATIKLSVHIHCN